MARQLRNSVLLVLLSSGSAAALAQPLACKVPQAGGDRPAVCMDAFFEAVADYGTWIQTDRFGTLFCPHPDKFDPDFRPYSKGHWVMSESGWTFVGDHPISWATDHYGRWVETGLHGCTWGWVPGEIWSPAWVEFRVGESVIAWRPAPFDGVPVQLSVPAGLRLQWVQLGPGAYAPSQHSYVAVKDNDFAAGQVQDVVLTGTELHAALQDTTALPDVRAGLHSRERYELVAQLQAAKEAAVAARSLQGEPPEPAARVRGKVRPGVAGTVQKGPGKTGSEGPPVGSRPGDTPPGAGKVPWGGDQNQGGFNRQGPQGGVKVLEWGKPKKQPLPPPRSPGDK